MDDRFIDLLRHGDVVGRGRFRGASDDPLSPLGIAQMRAEAEGPEDWDVLISSPARRCADFAREVAEGRGLPLELMSDLGERRFGAWENRLASEIPSSELHRFWTDPIGFTPPGAESFQALRERVTKAWERILALGARFPLIVTHGGVVRIVLGQVLDIPAIALMQIEVPYASRTRLRIPPGNGRPSLIFHGGPERCGALS